MSLSAPGAPDSPAILLRLLDVALLVVAAPILLLMGVPAVGYAAGAGAWIALRLLGLGVEHQASHTALAARQVTLRLSYLLSRLFLLALIVILVRKGDGRDAGLTALLVIVFAFTVELVIAPATRLRSR